MNGTSINDVSALSHLPNLRALSMNDVPIEDISPLGNISNLRALYMNNTLIGDLSPLLSHRKLAHKPEFGGLTFRDSQATRSSSQISRISRITNNADRAQMLFAYLGDTEFAKEDIDFDEEEEVEAILQGPILADALVDIRKTPSSFTAAALADPPARPIDQEHDDLLQVLQYGAARLGRSDAQNRIGQDAAQSLDDYATFAMQDPLNPRILIFLAEGLRAILADEMLCAALDGFDQSALSGVIANHDRLIRTYYPGAQTDPAFSSETDPDILIAGLFPQLYAAKKLVEEADQNGLFAPSVSDALEMMHRRAEGARRKIVTGEPEEVEAGTADLRRTAVLITAYLGRIKGRLTQRVNKKLAYARENPATAAVTSAAFVTLAQQMIASVTPVFNALWKLIGNLPLPF